MLEEAKAQMGKNSAIIQQNTEKINFKLEAIKEQPKSDNEVAVTAAPTELTINSEGKL